MNNMKRQDLQEWLERDSVEPGIIKSVFLAYDYLNDSRKCPSRADYAHRIADAVSGGAPTMGWSTSRCEMQIALDILKDKGIIIRTHTDQKYKISNNLDD